MGLAVKLLLFALSFQLCACGNVKVKQISHESILSYFQCQVHAVGNISCLNKEGNPIHITNGTAKLMEDDSGLGLINFYNVHFWKKVQFIFWDFIYLSNSLRILTHDGPVFSKSFAKNNITIIYNCFIIFCYILLYIIYTEWRHYRHFET